jgi:hypothetical protein
MATIDVIEAIRFNSGNDRVERVRWGKVDTAQNIWETDPTEADVIDVVDKIMSGGEVWTIVPLEGYTLAGPRVRVIADAQGVESIELADEGNEQRRTMRDLTTF